MEITSKVASIDNEGVSQEKRLAAYKGNMRNWRGGYAKRNVMPNAMTTVPTTSDRQKKLS